MKHILPAIIIIALASCTPKVYPLQGKNYGTISIIKSPRPVDTVWSGIIDLFATKGISIKTIDRGSGLIVTERYNFHKHYSFEIDGKLMDTTAWIALSYVAVKGGFPDNSIKVSADWNVRIKPDGTGSSINVNLTNIEAGAHYKKLNAVASLNLEGRPAVYNEEDYTFDGESTGVFEKIISDIVK